MARPLIMLHKLYKQDSKSAEVKDLERRMKRVIKYEFDRPVDTLLKYYKVYTQID